MLVLKDYTSFEETIKGSRFLSELFVCESQAQARELIKAQKTKYPDSTHVVHAFVIGPAAELLGMSDDGEPSGTAGKPIMGRIESAGLENILIVVVRYFGGILLGTGGLVVAYREAALDALAHAQIVECDITATRTLRFSYERMNEVMRLIKDTNSRILRQDWNGSNCEMEVEVSLKHVEKFGI